MCKSSRLWFSLLRVRAIAAITFTGLIRLKAFYFLLLFALLLIGNSVFLAQLSFQEEFHILKDIGLGSMSIFTSILAVMTSAQLIPSDLDDRTIYTILAKPVSRFEYLVGKLSAVLLLLALSIVIMSALFYLVLSLREEIVLRETVRQMKGAPPEQMAEVIRSIRASALNFNLLMGIVVIYLKACLLASITLFVSTLATTTIFTTSIAAFIYFIGHLQGTAREYWLQEHNSGWFTTLFLAVVTLFFPDLESFNLVDDIVAGLEIPTGLLAKTVMLGFFYVGFYLLFGWSVFYRKEL
jgi:ABC-type Na+ efflux pump permease subunit